jgi:glycosyltransferase involved in cell wall biosynthesis
MSVAKPTIIAIDGVARRLIEDAKAGLYVEPENPQAFVEAVLKLKENGELCTTYGQNGLDFVSKNFDRYKLAKNYIDIITKKVISEKSKG